MSQCLNVSCLAACLRERVSRAPAQPSYRKLARAARLGETHPGIRSPVARPKIRISAPQRPKCHLSATEAGSSLTRIRCAGQIPELTPPKTRKGVCAADAGLAAPLLQPAPPPLHVPPEAPRNVGGVLAVLEP
jgi:hypothetical protein